MTAQRDTGTPHLLADVNDAVLVLRFHRPEVRNALSAEMIRALRDQLAQAEVDDAIRCILLIGTGKGFCAGGDVRSMARHEGRGNGIDARIHRQRILQRATSGALFIMPKPTIAAINGPAAGAGLSLALACDLRIMASDAFLLTAFANVGLSGDFGGSYFLTQLVGAAKARELFYLSERVGAEEALRLGLANWISKPEDIESRAMEIARRLASGPSVALRYMKENLNRAIGGSVMDCLDLEATHHIHCEMTEDHKAAALAFVDRRKPVFSGH